MTLNKPNGNPFDCFHFTQNIWKSTTQVCFGTATEKGGGIRIAGRYLGAGNYLGQFEPNVLPPLY